VAFAGQLCCVQAKVQDWLVVQVQAVPPVQVPHELYWQAPAEEHEENVRVCVLVF